MNVTFLGVGSSMDVQPNTSILVQKESTILLDCGYSVTAEVWKTSTDPNFLDAIWISHAHGDHILGLPPLLMRMGIDGRTQPLLIYCPEGSAGAIQQVFSSSFPKNAEKATFVQYKEIRPSDRVRVGDLELSFAEGDHPVRNFAVKISDGTHSVCYAGDGYPTAETGQLYSNTDLLIHEGYTLEEERPGHNLIKDVIALGSRVNAKRLVIVHVHQDEREKAVQLHGELLPEKGEKIKIG